MITDEMIKQAAEILLHGDLSYCECRRSPFDKHDVYPPCSSRRQALDKAERILEAAAPVIRAQALEEAAARIVTKEPVDYWVEHLPVQLGTQQAMSAWLKALAAVEVQS
jgi:hypothetical protein